MATFKMAANVLTFLKVLRNTHRSAYGTFNLTVLPILKRRIHYRKVIASIKPANHFKLKSKTSILIFIISGIFFHLYYSRNKCKYLTVNGLEANSNFRKRFNFIADIVKQASNAVVFINSRNWRGSIVYNVASGFIVSEDGLILTNAHVVGNKKGQTVQVKLKNGNVFEGTVLDIDLYFDLAIIKIKSSNLPVLRLGKSNDLQPGEWVAAIGNPLNLANSITAGVVSSVQRSASELGLEHKNMQYIQTDAAITYGNSGGPLVNLDGEVVGVNAMTVFPGISFAVPVEYVKEFLRRSKMNKSQKVSSLKENYNGMRVLIVTPQLLLELKSKQVDVPDFAEDGLLICNVQENSPAHKSGLKCGDIIYSVDGNKKTQSLLHDLYTKDSMTLTIIRHGKMYTCKLVPEKIF